MGIVTSSGFCASSKTEDGGASMDQATFHSEISKIVSEHRLDKHPYVD
jgi:hypothetical protein